MTRHPNWQRRELIHGDTRRQLEFQADFAPPHDYPPSSSRPLWRCGSPGCGAWNSGDRRECRTCYAAVGT